MDGLSEHATMLYREISDKPEYEIAYLKEFSEDQIKNYLQKVGGTHNQGQTRSVSFV